MKRTLFGTDGIRSSVGNTPLTVEQLPKLGHAIGSWICHADQEPTILLATDTRASCPWIKSALNSGLLLHPLAIYDAGVLPTPAVGKLIAEQEQFTHGIVISASHNSFEDNGIKILTPEGKITSEDEEIISALFASPRDTNYTTPGTLALAPSALSTYEQIVTQPFSDKKLSGISVALDCANGALSYIAPHVFQSLGAQVHAYNTTPDGTNINKKCGALHAEELSKIVLAKNADVGFAFDGDGDRVIAVNREGHIKDGDDLLALLLTHPQYQQQKDLVGTIMSNEGLAHFVRARGGTLIRASVGDRHVAETLAKENLLLGGEPSGHIIARDYLNSGDGLYTALLITQLVASGTNETLKSFDRLPQFLINIPVRERKNLDTQPLATIIREYENKLGDGRLVIRYSGTEDVLRIMIEHGDDMHAQNVAQQLSQKLQQQLT